MKRIALLQLTDPRLSGDTLDYRSVIEQVVRMPLDRQTGATIDEMRKGIRILDALDRAEHNVIELEDADWEHLKQKVDHMQWAMVDRRLINFYDDVMQATDTPRVPERSNSVAV